ncbi:NAD(P)/FAD-dependent oxidoreductase [Brenneria corticis]|uniref:FAD-dependent oxidoreductase n=1 Tax=Brenneria corticis TaxID=2173106 RepID=A0A2U1U0S4_9GAMM|nr:FAD-binding oxidoreductase [Brenneria sp. CFCC 11842]PWC15247.1 FAD-dependent oxidoreductase [Brenneria sp. CFCC 11842]
MKIKHLPFDQSVNGWSAIIGDRLDYPQQQGKTTADWLIIGAGYAGTAFAQRLAEQRPDEHIVLLDAGEIGDNASGRNSGFVIDLPHNIGTSTAELEKAAAYRRLLQFGVAHLQEQVARHGINCDWSSAGKYHCAVSPKFNGLIDAYVRELNNLGEAYQVVEKDELARRLGTHFYHRAVYTPNCILLNPAALMQGLVAYLPSNVTVYANSPALSIDAGARIRVETPHGEIRARRLMMAINGAARGLPLFKGRLFAIATFATLTEPLNAQQLQRIGDMADWGVTPVNALAGATLRYTRDRRFLIREQVNFTPGLTTGALETGRHARRHAAIFARIFPQLKDVAMAHTWSGLISVTRNGAPIWGQLADNVYAAAGCNGSGLSKQTAAGRILADFALGEDNPLIGDMQSLGQANYLPPRPLLDIGVQGYLARERWRARSER